MESLPFLLGLSIHDLRTRLHGMQSGRREVHYNARWNTMEHPTSKGHMAIVVHTLQMLTLRDTEFTAEDVTDMLFVSGYTATRAELEGCVLVRNIVRLNGRLQRFVPTPPLPRPPPPRFIPEAPVRGPPVTVDSLPVSEISLEENDSGSSSADIEICPICLDSGGSFRNLGCNHKFHTSCLSRWVRSRRLSGNVANCPSCRTRYPTLVE